MNFGDKFIHHKEVFHSMLCWRGHMIKSRVVCNLLQVTGKHTLCRLMLHNITCIIENTMFLEFMKTLSHAYLRYLGWGSKQHFSISNPGMKGDHVCVNFFSYSVRHWYSAARIIVAIIADLFSVCNSLNSLKIITTSLYLKMCYEHRKIYNSWI